MRRSMWWLLTLCLCVSLPLSAQKFTGTITGVVTDPSGAVVAGAEVTVTNPSTGAVRTVKTSDHGEYSFPELPAANYDLTVTAASFKEHVTKGVELNVSSITTVNVAMAMGGAT